MNLKLRLFLVLLLGTALASCGSDDDSGGNGDGDNVPIGSAKKLLVSISVSARTVSMEAGLPETLWAFQYDDKNRLIADNAWGDGNRIEYQSDDSFPSSRICGENPSGRAIYPSSLQPAAFIRYSRGEGDLDGVSTKYYQKTILDSSGSPAGNAATEHFYLNLDGKVVVSGIVLDEKFQSSSWSYTYGEHGHLLKMEFKRADSDDVHEFVYDDKKGKTSEVTSPLWLFGDDPWKSGEYSRGGYLPDSFRLRHALTQPNNLLSYTYIRRAPLFYSTKETYDYTYDSDGYPTQALVTFSLFAEEGGTLHTYQYQQTYTYMPAH